MALIKRILLFLASLVFTIVLLIGTTASYAKDEFQVDIKEPNFRFYTIEWIDVADDNDKKYVCGTKVTTFDHSGRKFMMKYLPNQCKREIQSEDQKLICFFQMK